MTDEQNKYDNALKMSCAGQGKFAEPFLIGDFVFATDKYLIIKVPKAYCSQAYKQPTIDVEEQTKKLFSGENCSLLYDKEKIFDTIVHKLPDSKVIPVEGVWAECDECGGRGMVTYTYTTKDDKEFELNADCPVCNGKGSFKEREFDKDELTIAINGVSFKVERLRYLYGRFYIGLGYDNPEVTMIDGKYGIMKLHFPDGVEIIVSSSPFPDPVASIELEPFNAPEQ